MKIIIAVNASEKKRLSQYACSVRSGGHWGSSEIEIPEEKILSEILQKAQNKLEIPIYYMDLLLNWIAEVTGTGDILLAEDESLLGKINEALDEYHESLKVRYEREIRQVENAQVMVSKLARILHPQSPVEDGNEFFDSKKKK